MSLGSYISTLETVLDLDAQADVAAERRHADLAFQREQALWLAANALPIVTDDSLDADYRLGYAMSALERIARWAPALAGRIAG
jgi:hypothetical protein